MEALGEMTIDLVSAMSDEVKWILNTNVAAPSQKSIVASKEPSITAKALRNLTEDTKSVRSKVPSIASKTSKHDFLHKSKLDFPNYTSQQQDSKGPFVQQPRYFNTTAESSDQNRAFIQNLYTNDRNSYFKLVEILDLMSASDIDLKALTQLQ